MPRTLKLDRYVTDALMRDLVGHDQRPSAFLLYLHLTARATGIRRRIASASLRELAEDTGLSRSAVQQAVRVLVRRRLIRVTKASATAVPQYEVLRPWRATRRQG
jgi:hypothetical protein